LFGLLQQKSLKRAAKPLEVRIKAPSQAVSHGLLQEFVVSWVFKSQREQNVCQSVFGSQWKCSGA
jgi:hypothetical protein